MKAVVLYINVYRRQGSFATTTCRAVCVALFVFLFLYFLLKKLVKDIILLKIKRSGQRSHIFFGKWKIWGKFAIFVATFGR